MSHGDTPEEAIRNLQEVTELYISALLDKDLKIPIPQGLEITWDVISPVSGAGAATYILPSLTPPNFAPVSV